MLSILLHHHHLVVLLLQSLINWIIVLLICDVFGLRRLWYSFKYILLPRQFQFGSKSTRVCILVFILWIKYTWTTILTIWLKLCLYWRATHHSICCHFSLVMNDLRQFTRWTISSKPSIVHRTCGLWHPGCPEYILVTSFNHLLELVANIIWVKLVESPFLVNTLEVLS